MSRRYTIMAHELRTQLRSVPFAALLLMLVGAASTINPVVMIPGGGDATLPVRAVANSVYALTPSFAISAFFVYPFFASLMAGLSVLRDDECGMTELLHSTPLTKAEYLWSKFSGVLLALLVAVGVHLLIVMGFREAAVSGVVRGPVQLSAYLLPVLAFVVPGVLWVAGLAFAIGARTRSSMAVYVLPVALFVLEFVWLWNWHPRGISPALDTALMMVDPTGLRWLTHDLFAAPHDMAWYNTAPFAFDRVIVAGRLVTILVPLTAVAWVSRRRRERPARAARALGNVPLGNTLLGNTPLATVRALPTTMRMRTPSALRATATIWSAECRSLVRQPSVYLFAALLFAVVMEVGGSDVDPYGSTTVLTAGGIAIAALPVVTVLTCLFLLFVVVESLYRDRTTGFDVIALSTPVPTSSFIAGQALAAGALIAGVTAVCVASGGALLLAQSGATTSWWPLLLVFGGVLVPTYVLWVAFVTAISTVARNRAAAIAVGIVALLITAAQFMRGAMTWLTNWPLWGALRWTEFAVFPLDREALLLNRVLALTAALALFGVARWSFVRTESDPAAARSRRRARGWPRLAVRALPLAALPLFTGAFLAIRVHDAFDRPRASAPTVTNAEPSLPALIEHVDAAVDLAPAQRRLAVDGAYDVVNRSDVALAALPFTVPPSFGVVTWGVDGQSVAARGLNGRVLLPLRTPLPPGGRARVTFSYAAVVNPGISRNGGPVDAFVLPAGVLVSTHRGDFLPVPGHPAGDDAALRPVANALSEQPSSSSSEPAIADSDDMGTQFNHGWPFTATMRVEAPRALIVNGVGNRMASIVSGARTVTVWESRVPVAALNLTGAAYVMRRAEGVAVYHHPLHTRSLDVITNTLASARRRYSTWFHPYPWSELRLSEYADLSTQATSYPTNIVFSEGLGFLTAGGSTGGLAFAVTAHEAAHQWWGHLLAAGNGPGSGVLVEGMADFATLLLFESERGAEARRAYARLLEQQYLEARSAAPEQSLLNTRERTDTEATISQKKGAWAMWMLHRQLGPERMFPALRAFIAAHRSPGQFATLNGMLDTLRAHAPDSAAFDALRAQWFAGTGLPAFRVYDARCQVASGGAAWRCEATVQNHGNLGATVGVAAMIGAQAALDAQQRVQIDAGARRALTWTLTKRPDRIVVDPDVEVLQAGREQAMAVVPHM